MSVTATNLKEFEIQLEDFAKAIDTKLETVMRRIALDLHGRISLRTPVDTGRARASWDIGVGSPSEFVPPASKGSAKKKGKASLGSGQIGNQLASAAAAGGTPKDVYSQVEAITGSDVVFVTSALDYIGSLEDGSSNQAPAGMVLLSVTEIEIELETILNDLKA